jgi:hypothetical protein
MNIKVGLQASWGDFGLRKTSYKADVAGRDFWVGLVSGAVVG